MHYEAYEPKDPIEEGAWVAEAIDSENDGDIYVALFLGPDAQDRAKEYAAWKNAQVECVQ